MGVRKVWMGVDEPRMDMDVAVCLTRWGVRTVSMLVVLVMRMVVNRPGETGAGNGPRAPELGATLPRHVRSAAPARIAAAPVPTLKSTFSRNTTHATASVKTPSRFSSRAAELARLAASPVISRTEAIIPPLRMAPNSTGQSDLRRRVSRRPLSTDGSAAAYS